MSTSAVTYSEFLPTWNIGSMVSTVSKNLNKIALISMIALSAVEAYNVYFYHNPTCSGNPAYSYPTPDTCIVVSNCSVSALSLLLKIPNQYLCSGFLCERSMNQFPMGTCQLLNTCPPYSGVLVCEPGITKCP